MNRLPNLSQCKCTHLSKYLCQCQVNPSEISSIDSRTLSEIINISKSDLSSTDLSIKSLNQTKLNLLKDLTQDSTIQIMALSRNDSNSQFEIIKNLNLTSEQILQNYFAELKNLNKIKKTIQKFLKFLITKQGGKIKYKEILTKLNLYYLSQPRVRASSANHNGNLVGVNEAGENRVRNSSGPGNRNCRVDEVMIKVAADERTEKRLLIWLGNLNRFMYFDVVDKIEDRYEARVGNLFEDDMVHLNVADKFLFCFYGRTRNPSRSNEFFMLNLQSNSITRLKKSYFPKQGTSLPLIHNSRLYLFGGINDIGHKSTECEFYNFNTTTWGVNFPLSTPASYVSAVTLNNSIFLAGNDFNCIKIFNPTDSVYTDFIRYDKIDVYQSHIFLIKMYSNLYLFCQKGVHMIPNSYNSAALEYYGAYVCTKLGHVLQYVVRENSAFILMAAGRVIKFTPVRGSNSSEVFHIFK